VDQEPSDETSLLDPVETVGHGTTREAHVVGELPGDRRYGGP
jgi:hypothetical protein